MMRRVARAATVILSVAVIAGAGPAGAAADVAATRKTGKDFRLPASRTAARSPRLQQAEALEEAFVQVAESVGPAVVSVVASYTRVSRFSPWGDEFLDEFFRHFFEAPQYERRQPVVSGGSGFIVTPDGYILTNAHVIGQSDNVNVTVSLLDKKEYKAAIVGFDEGTDVAVLKIDPAKDLACAPLGDSDEIRVGAWAIAIGNPFALQNTVTVGVISAKGRKPGDVGGRGAAQYATFIQTDASINRGNSGGPLLNIRGEVIGINTMIVSPSGGSVGIGFAIPINIAKNVMESLIREGRVIRPQLGVMYRAVPPEVARKLGLPEGAGMEISSVMEDSAAERAGLKPGDVILSMDGKPLKDADDLRSGVLERRAGETVEIEVFRKGRKVAKKITLGEMPTASQKRTEPAESRKRDDGKRETWLGMRLAELSAELAEQLKAGDSSGVVVVEMDPDSPAAAAGVDRWDIVREIEQRPVASLDELSAARQRIGKDDNVLLLIERQGSTMYLVVKQKEDKKGG